MTEEDLGAENTRTKNPTRIDLQLFESAQE